MSLYYFQVICPIIVVAVVLGSVGLEKESVYIVETTIISSPARLAFVMVHLKGDVRHAGLMMMIQLLRTFPITGSHSITKLYTIKMIVLGTRDGPKNHVSYTANSMFTPPITMF